MTEEKVSRSALSMSSIKLEKFWIKKSLHKIADSSATNEHIRISYVCVFNENLKLSF